MNNLFSIVGSKTLLNAVFIRPIRLFIFDCALEGRNHQLNLLIKAFCAVKMTLF